MGRIWVVVAVLVMVGCLPGLVTAQGFLPNFQGMNAFDLGRVQLSPSAKVGYQLMAVNVNIPVPNSAAGVAVLTSASTRWTSNCKTLESGSGALGWMRVWTGAPRS